MSLRLRAERKPSAIDRASSESMVDVVAWVVEEVVSIVVVVVSTAEDMLVEVVLVGGVVAAVSPEVAHPANSPKNMITASLVRIVCCPLLVGLS